MEKRNHSKHRDDELDWFLSKLFSQVVVVGEEKCTTEKHVRAVSRGSVRDDAKGMEREVAVESDGGDVGEL